MIKLFVIMMRNNSPEIMTKQQRYRQKFLEKETVLWRIKKRLQKMVCHQYKTLSEEQNDKNKEYARNQYQNMSEKGK